MNKFTFRVVVILIAIFSQLQVLAQDKTNNKFGKGISIVAADSSFSMKFGLRFQTLYNGFLNLENQNYDDALLIRRYRLKFDGFAYNPKLVYKLELGISNLDIAGGNNTQSALTSRIILDAVVKWNFAPDWTLWVGQTKLPGNRERVVSSQNLQFVDRSALNSRFNLDRDAGVQMHYSKNNFNFISSISTGEGRNIVTTNAGGYDYTLRGEFLPFGKFKNKGDYSESDLSREPTPKLSIGVTYDYNSKANRERGQLGEFMSEQRDLEAVFADAHFKFRGFSSLMEFVSKRSPDGPVVLDSSGNFLEAYYTGTAFNWQAGYLFKNNYEIAARFTQVTPEEITLRNNSTQYTLAGSKYIVGHNLKIQGDVTLIKEANIADILMMRLQMELAF